MSRGTLEQIAVCILLVCAPQSVSAQAITLTKVVSKPVVRTTELPGEFYPFLSVELHAKVTGYIDKVFVDRGSAVRQGDLLVQLSAPELVARIVQVQAQVASAESDETQAEAELAAAQSNYQRLQEAANTPGAVAENDLIQAKQQTDAVQALVRSRQRTVESLRANLRSQQDLAAYLRVTAPFDGVITTRYIHPGALVGPGSDVPLLQLDQISHLRLAVAVPEADVAAIARGMTVDFKVPAHPERTFSGVIARPARALDRNTRTMPVELDVRNTEGLLAPGMYPSVRWPVDSSRAALLVPPSSIVTTTERVFVIRYNNGRAEWVNVQKGATIGNLVEVQGGLKSGDRIVEHATDELRDGAELKAVSR